MDSEILEDKENLIQSEEYDFQITKDELLFICKNSTSQSSIQKLEKFGGIIGLFDKLKLNPNIGLSENNDCLDMFSRGRVFGKNDPVIPKLPSFFFCIIDVMKDKMVLILIFFGLISFFLGIIENKDIWFEYCSIFISVCIIVIVLGMTEYSMDKLLINFQIELENKDVRVLRNNIEMNIPKYRLVVGDLLIVSNGDIVPVDGLLIQSHNILYEYENKWYKHYNINYKNLNNTDIPLIYSGSNIYKGYGTLLVLAVGVNAADSKIKLIRFNNRKNKDYKVETYLNIEKKSFISSNVFPNVITDCSDYKSYDKPENKSDKEIDKLTLIKSNSIQSQPQIENINMITDFSKEHNLRKSSTMKISTVNPVSEVIKLNKSSHKSISNLYSRSPINESLNKLSIYLVRIGFVFSSISTLILILKSYFKYPFKVFLGHIPDLLQFGLLIVVLLMSKGLLLTLNLYLNSFVKKMKDQNTIIKNIEACEAMACANILCTDYSRILSNGEMNISSIYMEDKLIDEFMNIRFIGISEDCFEFFCEAISINSTAYLSERATTKNHHENFSESFNQKRFYGDNIDSALLTYLNNININYLKYRNNLDRRVIDCSDFNMTNNIQYTVINMADKNDYVRVYIRGSPSGILSKINAYINKDAELSPINNEKYENLLQICNHSLYNGLTPVFICYRDINKDLYYNHTKNNRKNDDDFKNFLIEDLNMIALIRLREETKQNVHELIKELQNSRLNIKLVSSMEKEKSFFIADKIGILKEKNSQIEQINADKSKTSEKLSSKTIMPDSSPIYEKMGIKKLNTFITPNLKNKNKEKFVLDTLIDLRKFIDEEAFKIYSNSFENTDIKVLDYLKLSKAISNCNVISRAEDLDKFIIIALLRQNGEIVINLGDNVCDTLAMSNSNISISMWSNTSDICRENADIIIMDGNLKSISTTIIYGRNLFETIRKFLQFNLTAIFVLLLIVVFCSIFNFTIYPSQVVWFNLIINTFYPLVFSMEKPKQKFLSKKRYLMNTKIIDNNTIIFVAVQSFIQFSILVVIILYVDYIFDVQSDIGLNYKSWGPANGHHTTIFFCILVLMQIFNAFVSRNLEKKMILFKDLKNNKYFVIMQVIVIVLHHLLIYFGSNYIQVRMISFYNILKCFVISSIVLFSPLILKFIHLEEENVIRENELFIETVPTNYTRRKSDYGLKLI